MHPMLNIGVRAARAAGKIIAQNVDRLEPQQIASKRRNDFVTEIDTQAEAEIISIIQKAYPDHAILGEEGGLVGDENAEYRWVIDPIDGTTNFIHGLPGFCVSIGLLQNGRPYQAVIYDPMSQELFTASKGEGAYLDNKRIRVSSQLTLEGSLLMSSTLHSENEMERRFLDIMRRGFDHHAAGLRRVGSAAIELAYVAAGRVDGAFMNGLSPWDMAAGALIVREAGGLITDFEGGEGYMDSGEVFAGNPKVMHEMLKMTAPLSAKRKPI